MKNALITGGTAGIGKETARALLQRGYRVTLVARDQAKGEALVRTLGQEIPGAQVAFEPVDLSRFGEVRAFAQRYRAANPCIDALVLNAGLFTPRLMRSESGHEFMFATTHLGHFLLTHELLPSVRAAQDPRIVVTSSVAHKYGTLVEFDNFENPGDNHLLLAVPFFTYGRSKLANLLFVREFGRRVADPRIRINAFHPGAVRTEIWRGTPGLFNTVISPFLVSEVQGAQTQIQLASEPGLTVSGEYWYRGRVARSTRAGRDPQRARELWDYSLRVFGIERFGEP